MWNVIEDLLERYGDSLGRASNVGKYWISMFNVLRFMFLMSIADNSFGKEALECNTQTPGCQKLCTNKARQKMHLDSININHIIMK